MSSEVRKRIKQLLREDPALQFVTPAGHGYTAPYSGGNPVNSEQFLDETGREYQLTPQTPSNALQTTPSHINSSQVDPQTRLYGGIAARYWVGEPGNSDLVAGIGYFYEPIRVADQEGVRSEMHEAFQKRVVDAVYERTGLEISPIDLERIQYLEIWTAEPDLIERCKAFEQGWSALKPAGKGVRDLTGADIAQLFRRVGAKREE